jgi:hypothetical protein
MAAIDAHSLPPAHRPRPLSKILARLVLIGLLPSATAILALTLAEPIRCERQTSDFGGDFGGDFGTNAIDCRFARIKDSPTFRLGLDPLGIAIEWKGRWLGFPPPPSA